MLSDFVALKSLKDVLIEDPSRKVTCSDVQIILKELLESLSAEQDNLELVKRTNLPKIDEFNRQKTELLHELSLLKDEVFQFNSINPVSTLNKRLHDFKTEGEYIAKILNRNIHEEFISQMKRELRNLMNSFIASESFEQTTASFPDCDELNEKLTELSEEGMGLHVSSTCEKFTCTINKCHREICTKVYPNNREKQESFASFCVGLIENYFKKKINNNGNATRKSLPQFVSILLNDLTYSSLFINIKLKGKRTRTLDFLRKQLFKSFISEQEKEIESLYDDYNDPERSIKKISLFLVRLGNVLKPVMLRTDLVNVLVILLNYAQELGWKYLSSLKDIDQDEIDSLKRFCTALIALEDKIVSFGSCVKNFLKFRVKLEATQRLLDESLIHIINAYHRCEYPLMDSEMSNFIKAIFAPSPLRNEFIKELSLNIQDINNDFY